MAMGAFISIVIPTYNVEKYVARAIKSCINQSFSNIEILIIDDCGSDRSIDIARDFANQDKRIKIIHNPKNLGTFTARLVGMKHASAQYTLFLDADDYIKTNTCQILYDEVQDFGAKYNNMNFTAPDIVFFGMEFHPRTYTRIPPPIIKKPCFGEEILKAVFLEHSTPPWCVCGGLYRSEYMQDVGELICAHLGKEAHIRMAEDVLKSFFLSACAKSSIGIRDRLYVYCEDSLSITRRIDIATRDRKIDDLQNVVDKIMHLHEVRQIAQNKYCTKAQIKTANILRSVIELEHRYDDAITPAGESKYPLFVRIFGSYLFACAKSLKYYRKWKTFARMLFCIISLGKIKI